MIKYNKNDDKTQIELEFGTGDICINGGHFVNDDNKIIGLVAFSNQSPREIGAIGDVKPGQECKVGDFPVIMTFGKIESIDTVIRQLLEAKEDMIAKIMESKNNMCEGCDYFDKKIKIHNCSSKEPCVNGKGYKNSNQVKELLEILKTEPSELYSVNIPMNKFKELLERSEKLREYEENDVALISKGTYSGMHFRLKKLSALEAAGVDNWDGYDDAMKLIEMGEE